MSDDWKKDPRLSQMDPQKLYFRIAVIIRICRQPVSP